MVPGARRGVSQGFPGAPAAALSLQACNPTRTITRRSVYGYFTAPRAMEESRAALLTYAREAREALYDVDADTRQTTERLDDQRKSWRSEVRHGEDAVLQARHELSRRKLLRISDRPPDTTEQEQ